MTEARSAIDIAKEIVKKIREISPTLDESEADIYHTIMGLRKLTPLSPFRGWRKENKKYAAKLIEWIEEGQALLAAPATGVPAGFIFIDAISLGEAEDRQTHFEMLLTRMKERCEWIAKQKLGAHGNSGYQQERAAIIARGLMEKHGLPLAYSSPTSPYRTAARLFLEAMTEQTLEGGEDIERACEAVAKLPMMSGLEIFARL